MAEQRPPRRQGQPAQRRPAPRPATRRSERPGEADRPREPQVPEDVTWHDLDREARAGLRSLPKEMAERVGGHLVMAGLLVDEDPQLALAHAQVARRLAARVAVVREAMALTAYACGDFETALAELRAYRRLSGDEAHLPLMADCERGLGRPERALDLCASAPSSLPSDVQRELRIVAAGARSDLGQDEAALLLLTQDPTLNGTAPPTLSVLRLRYAYADTLHRMGRTDEAATWFEQVARGDVDGLTDAAERLDG